MTQDVTNLQYSTAFHPETLVLHGGYRAEEHWRSAQVPIYQTTSFVFDNAQYGADLFDLAVEGHIYSRVSNPTLTVLEERIAALEGGSGRTCRGIGDGSD